MKSFYTAATDQAEPIVDTLIRNMDAIRKDIDAISRVEALGVYHPDDETRIDLLERLLGKAIYVIGLAVATIGELEPRLSIIEDEALRDPSKQHPFVAEPIYGDDEDSEFNRTPHGAPVPNIEDTLP